MATPLVEVLEGGLCLYSVIVLRPHFCVIRISVHHILFICYIFHLTKGPI